MSKDFPPDIWFPLGVRAVSVALPNGSSVEYALERHERGCLVVQDCRNPAIREKLLAKGGVEAIKRKWYVNPGYEDISVPQGDGTQHHHKPEGEDRSFECASVACNQRLLTEYHTVFPPREFGGSRGIPAGTNAPPYAVLGPGQRATVTLAAYSDKLERERWMTQEQRQSEYQQQREDALANAAATGAAKAAAEVVASLTKAKR
jgi:hypothetical protein